MGVVKEVWGVKEMKVWLGCGQSIKGGVKKIKGCQGDKVLSRK